MRRIEPLSDRASNRASITGLFAFSGALVVMLALVIGTLQRPATRGLRAALDQVATARLDAALQQTRAMRVRQLPLGRVPPKPD